MESGMEWNKTTIVSKFIKCTIIAQDKCTVIVLYYMWFLSFFIWIIVRRKGDSLLLLRKIHYPFKNHNTFGIPFKFTNATYTFD